MRMLPTFLRLPHRRAHGFTLVEMMVSLAVFSLCFGMIYETLTAVTYLMAKNSSINKSNEDLRRSYYRLLSTLESASIFVDCATYNPSKGVFTAVAAGTWGNSVRFMTQQPVSCWIAPDDGSNYNPDTNPPPPTRSKKLASTDQSVTLYYNAAVAPSIPASARFYPDFPVVSETVSTGSSLGVKPGLGISTVTVNVAGTPPCIQISLNNPLGGNACLDCNRAYLLVESAFAVVQMADGSKQLWYFSDTSQTAKPVIVCRDLDGANQIQTNDTTIPMAGTPGTFCMPAGSNAVQTLLPIRAPEYANVMTRYGGDSSSNNTWINVNTKFHRRVSL